MLGGFSQCFCFTPLLSTFPGGLSLRRHLFPCSYTSPGSRLLVARLLVLAGFVAGLLCYPGPSFSLRQVLYPWVSEVALRSYLECLRSILSNPSLPSAIGSLNDLGSGWFSCLSPPRAEGFYLSLLFS